MEKENNADIDKKKDDNGIQVTSGKITNIFGEEFIPVFNDVYFGVIAIDAKQKEEHK